MQLVNLFQIELLRAGLWWADRGCRETVKNGGSCIDDVHRRFGTTAREAYCAELIYVIAAQAAQAAGITNPVPKTRGACDMLQRSAAKGLRIDKEPGLCSIGYHGSNPKYSTGHIVLVVDVTPTTMRTVEGNNDDRIDDWVYPLDIVRSRPRTQRCQRGVGWDFIHIEDAGGPPTHTLDGVPRAQSGPSPLVLALATGAVLTGYMATQALRA